MDLEINVKLRSAARADAACPPRAVGMAPGPDADGRFANRPYDGSGTAPSLRVLAIAEMFGIGLDERHELDLYRKFRLTIRRGDVVYITGPSGCGKSVLLREIGSELRRRFAAGVPHLVPRLAGGKVCGGEHTLSPNPCPYGRAGQAGEQSVAPGARFRKRKRGTRGGRLARTRTGKQGKLSRPCTADAPQGADPEGPLASLDEVDASGSLAVIDRFPVELNEALRLASVAGINDAFLLLRPPAELSDGQRYRWRLAMLLARGARTILIDEFCSTLDRQTARAVAYRVRKYADRTGATFIVATAHDDLAEDLCPDVIVRKKSAARVEVRGP